MTQAVTTFFSLSLSLGMATQLLRLLPICLLCSRCKCLREKKLYRVLNSLQERGWEENGLKDSMRYLRSSDWKRRSYPNVNLQIQIALDSKSDHVKIPRVV